MQFRAAALVLFVCFCLAAIGAAVTTAKTTNQAAISGKEHRIARPAG
jgi:hypothetical protein